MNDASPPYLKNLAEQDLADLRYARSLLENPGLAARLANLVGMPIEKGFKMLPKGWSETVHRSVHSALLQALRISMISLADHPGRRSSNFMHKMLAGASGGIGGAFGLAALPVELPISTALMMRSIADIARSEGARLDAVETKLACLEVFALGGRSEHDDAAENAYWIVRTMLARSVSDAASYLAQKGVVEEGAPAIVHLLAKVAARFGVVVSEQAAAKAVPVVGAATGTIINLAFMDHFQNMARGHFIIRRLESEFGTDQVKAAYEAAGSAAAKEPLPRERQLESGMVIPPQD